MSDTYDDLIKTLDNQYDLAALNLADAEFENECLKEGKRKIRKAVDHAKKKGGFSNTKIARYLKEENLHNLIEIAGQEFTKVQLTPAGPNLAAHKKVFKHFVDTMSALYEYKNETSPLEDGVDVTQLIKLQQWIFIGLNTMLDAAAIPASNDMQVKRTRSEMTKDDEREILPFRPEIVAIKRKIGRMICFQIRLDFVSQIWWRWFANKKVEATKKGSAGLRYFQRDMDENIQNLLSHLQIKARSDQDLYEKIQLINNFDAETHGQGADAFLITLGSWVYDIIRANLTSIEKDKEGNEKVVHFFSEVPRSRGSKKKPVYVLEMLKDDKGVPVLAEAWSKSLRHAQIKKPMLSPPKQLSADHRGGRKAHEKSPTLKTHKGHMAMSQQRVDFFNRQALVPFKINDWVFKVLTQFKESNLSIGNFDYYIRQEDLRQPSDRIADKPNEYYDLDDNQKLKWCKQHPDWRKVNREYSKEYEAHIQRLRDSLPSKLMYGIAEDLVEKPVFWIPTRPEFRSRLITDVLFLSYQGRDAAKALIKLARPVSIEDQHARERTRWWLANQLAANFNKTLDKLPFSKRVNKIESPVMQEKIKAVALMEDDFDKGREVLQEVDDAGGKPMLFAAACREWYELFMSKNPKTTTDLIVSNDCSCSGQQFAAGWRRSKDLAIATNAYPNDVPHDLYKDVFNEVHKRVKDDGGKFSQRHTRALENKGFGRDICKGGIQPAMYGSGEATALEGVVAKLDKYAKKGMKLSEDERSGIISNYQDALDEVAEMNTTNTWFKEVSSLLARRKKDHIVIPTPLGDSIIMTYEGSETYRIDTFRFGSCTYKDKTKGKSKEKDSRQRTQLVKPNGTPDRRKWRTALAANTTHGAGDASMLALALHDADFDFVTCHDSVGCAGPHMDALRQRMRSAYVQVVRFNIFEEILKANGIKEPRPDWVNPMVNNWDPEEAINSEYLLS